MASDVSVVLEVPDGVALPPEGEVRRLLAEHIEDEYLVEHIDEFQDHEAKPARGEPYRLPALPAFWHVEWYSERWGVAGAREFAEALSELVPEGVVKFEEEWDNRDADEAGGEGWHYQAGRLIRRGSIGWHWEDVSPGEAEAIQS